MNGGAAVCRKAGFELCGETEFELCGETEFEFPKGRLMRSNDWRLDLTGAGRR
ncbi:hypothetical protein V1634_31385 [Plantactinospora veratri]|uniref:Uncharacterized protein n=1 Tax=Plantactinospora veratri TaxID=1436122 RepID=A0ABU7SP92_9ACTN